MFRCPICRAQGFSSNSESVGTHFPVENAYELLGVSETCSFAEIKASFRKLAKETHPDLADSSNDSSASRRFVQILAAYQILSDSEKRAHYDRYLLSQKKLVLKHSGQGSKLHFYKSHDREFKEMEVVEWLKWYRLAINDIVSEKRVVVGTGYFDVLERDFYSAIQTAYFGPEIESMELLPECFEAEERSSCETPEVLHLVSGRDLFGMVCLANKIPEISSTNNEKLTSIRFLHPGLCQSIKNVNIHTNAEVPHEFGIPQIHGSKISSNVSDTYRDLELHVSGRVVAVASRDPPRSYSDGLLKEDAEDRIHVFLNSVGTRIQLGTIAGLGTSPDEGSCYVYDSRGAKTHVIMKHRTLLVKHMHWYEIGEKVSICECRCTRAKLPPSR
ncbi:Chaperone protein DnaJ [Senna tora]|uniref:Chaperone protein DnaJ n=1 Tax=Senna tora TaxID=362788 RepID=A0A834WPJ8_9FABA|nr:Chaperone protein DnaJ [Senna tora]